MVRAVAPRATAAAVQHLPRETVDGVMIGALYDEKVEVLRPLLNQQLTASLVQASLACFGVGFLSA